MMKRFLLALLLLPLCALGVPLTTRIVTSDDVKTNNSGLLIIRGTQTYTTNGVLVLWDPLTLNAPTSNRVMNGGSMIFSNSAVLNLGSNAIHNVAEPTAISDPITLGYFLTNANVGDTVYDSSLSIETNITSLVSTAITTFGCLVISNSGYAKIRIDSSTTFINNTSNTVLCTAYILLNGASIESGAFNVSAMDERTRVLTEVRGNLLASNFTVCASAKSASPTNNNDIIGRLDHLRIYGIR